MQRSVSRHNVDLDIAADWVEGTLLFDDDTVSKASVIDALCDNHIYDAQAFAFELVDNVWRELKRRQSWLGSAAPYDVSGNSAKSIVPWRERPAHAFCLALSLSKWYPKWSSIFGADFTEQGALFELLSSESGRHMLPGWEVHQTGWTSSTAKKLNDVVSQVARLLHEPVGEIRKWTKPMANEAGLDLLWFRPYGDQRAGIPVYLMQCASGGNYDGKLHTPNLRIWTRIVQFTAEPKKAFSTPFSLTDSEFTRVCNLVDGLLLDRYRLLAPGRTTPAWVSAPLAQRLITWIEPRVAQLPIVP